MKMVHLNISPRRPIVLFNNNIMMRRRRPRHRHVNMSHVLSKVPMAIHRRRLQLRRHVIAFIPQTRQAIYHRVPPVKSTPLEAVSLVIMRRRIFVSL